MKWNFLWGELGLDSLGDGTGTRTEPGYSTSHSCSAIYWLIYCLHSSAQATGYLWILVFTPVQQGCKYCPGMAAMSSKCKKWYPASGSRQYQEIPWPLQRALWLGATVAPLATAPFLFTGCLCLGECSRILTSHGNWRVLAQRSWCAADGIACQRRLSQRNLNFLCFEKCYFIVPQ